MSVPETAIPPALKVASDADVSNWVEALAEEDCTPDEFVAEILRREDEDSEAIWEALSLLDQHFRRDNICRDVFVEVKSRLQKHPVSSARPAPVAAPRPVTTPTAATTNTEDAPLHSRLRVGDHLAARYRVVDILGSTAEGTLVEALDEHKINLPGIRRRVVIEVMAESVSRAPQLLPQLARLMALSHPAIVRLLDVEAQSGTLLLISELVNGVSLQKTVARIVATSTDNAVARSAVRTVASALAYAHSQHVTHGDVNSTNVIISPTGEAFLLGFERSGVRHGTPVADRLAFAWFAYELLKGINPADQETRNDSRVTPPPGLTRAQWRVLRDTMTGKDDIHPDVLTVFANEKFSADAPVTSSRQPGVQQGVGPRSTGWISGAAVAAVLGVGAYFYFTYDPAEPADRIATPVTPVPIPSSAAKVPVAAPIEPTLAAAERPRIDLTRGVTWVETTAPVARIWVRRRGQLNGDVNFKWWTESGSALPDRDFRRIEVRTAKIPGGAEGTELLVPLIPDGQRGEARNFYVKIDAPSHGASLGARTLTQVAIVPPGYRERPDSP